MVSGKAAWYDIEMRGRRLEGIHLRMTTEFWKAIDHEDGPKLALAFAYLDRLNKLEHTIQPYVEQITGLNRFLKKHDREKDTIQV